MENNTATQQLPVALSPASTLCGYANVFQTRVADGMVVLSLGFGMPEVATDTNGQETKALVVEMSHRYVLTLDSAKSLADLLGRIIAEVEAMEKGQGQQR